MVEIGSASIKNQDKIVIPSISEQVVTPDQGYTGLGNVIINGVTSEIDANIIAANIREGVTILGVTGTFRGVDFALEEFPPFTSIGGTDEGDFDEVGEISLITDGGEGYQVLLLEEEESAEGVMYKQKVAFAAQFSVVGIKQFNILSQKWEWIKGSPENSITEFVQNGTLVQVINGKQYTYNIYECATDYIVGERELRFYTTLPDEV
jgi:hypothetical protein